jgi:hypothetical protein
MSPQQKLRIVSSNHPDPPYPADTKANGWKPEFDVTRIITSDTWTLAENDERPWLLRIWMEAWLSVPVGSMPADRRLFARRIGCKKAFLDAQAEILLRGWELHSDGLLYHAYITEQVIGMLSKRRSSAERVKRHRTAKAAQNTSKSADVTHYKGDVTRNQRVSNAQEQEQEQEQEEKKTPLPPSGSKAKPKPAPWQPPPWINPTAWAEFEQHRREMGKPLTDLARTKAANRLRDLSHAEQQQCIDTSIQARWTGLFPEKAKHANTSHDAKFERRKRTADEIFNRARAHFDEVD